MDNILTEARLLRASKKLQAFHNAKYPGTPKPLSEMQNELAQAFGYRNLHDAQHRLLDSGPDFVFMDGKPDKRFIPAITNLWNTITSVKRPHQANGEESARRPTLPRDPFVTETFETICSSLEGDIRIAHGTVNVEDIWAERAMSFIKAILKPLIFFRDNLGWKLDIDMFREYCELGAVKELARHAEFDYPGMGKALAPLQEYLRYFPGYDAKAICRQDEGVRCLHWRVTMTLVRVLTRWRQELLPITPNPSDVGHSSSSRPDMPANPIAPSQNGTSLAGANPSASRPDRSLTARQEKDPFVTETWKSLYALIENDMRAVPRFVHDRWHDHATNFLEAILRPLVFLRDSAGWQLNINMFREYCELETLDKLAWHTEYPGMDKLLGGLRGYLLHLPQYDAKAICRQRECTLTMHGYATMQLIRALTPSRQDLLPIIRRPLCIAAITGANFFKLKSSG